MLGKYSLLELIGSGAMGDVYRAEHVLLGRRVAVKVLRRELAREQSLVERFFSEARAVNLVGHPHIVEVTDFARERDGTVWFVMEYLDGSDLGSLLRDERPSLRRSLEIARQICDALDAVHGVGIVHRDIKPENVFLVQRDGRDFVKLLDFGIARLPELPDGEHTTTLRGVVMGTPPYMAPEQARGLEIDPRSDVYAVGAVLFELITGRPVFEQPTLRAMLADITLKTPPQLSAYAQLPSCVRDTLDQLIARCLAKDPDGRPDTAKALALELSAIGERLEAWATGPDAAAASPTLPHAKPERSARDSAELLAVCRPKWPARALWLGAALVAGATALWGFGPWTPASQAPSVQAAVPSLAVEQAAALDVALVATSTPAPQRPAATIAIAAPPTHADAQLVAVHERDLDAEPRSRSARRLAPSAVSPPEPERMELPSEPGVVPVLSLAAAPAQRDLDPEKLLDPFAGE